MTDLRRKQTLAEQEAVIREALDLGLQAWRTTSARERFLTAFDALTAVVADAARIAAIDTPEHVLVLGPDRWTVEHTLDCRESGRMAECEVHERIADWIDEVGEPDLPKGRYYVGEGDLLPDALVPVEAT